MTDRAQTIFVTDALNGFIENVQSLKAHGHHVSLRWSHNVIVSGSFFNETVFNGPGNFNGYGVLIRNLCTKILVTNNVFRDVRHHMPLEVGANYNVFSYNFAVDSVRDYCHENGEAECTNDPSCNCEDTGWINGQNAYITGDLAVHGNFPHHNLYEGNVFYIGTVDNSHQQNGPHMFFRNKALGQPAHYDGWLEGYGFAVDGISDDQSIVGNEVAADSLLLMIDRTSQYGRLAEGILTAANVVRGVVDWDAFPADTPLPSSLYLQVAPDYWPGDLTWPPYGPDVTGSATNEIPAQIRWENDLSLR